MTRGHGLPQMLSKGSRELLQGARSEAEDGLPRRNRSSSRWEPLSQSLRWGRLSLVARWLWELHGKAERGFLLHFVILQLIPSSSAFLYPSSLTPPAHVSRSQQRSGDQGVQQGTGTPRPEVAPTCTMIKDSWYSLTEPHLQAPSEAVPL